MYKVYSNFQLNKEKDCVKISVDSLLVLENKEDDDLVVIGYPKYFDDITELKFPVDKYENYNIYILNVTNPSRITDYKKIWKLGGFGTNGLYDNYYDGDSGRIYFGITKNYPQFKSSVWMKNISILVPKDTQLPFESIFDFFAENKFDDGCDSKKQDYILSSISKYVKNSIVVNKVLSNGIYLNLYGDKIEQKFDVSELPKIDIIER